MTPDTCKPLNRTLSNLALIMTETSSGGTALRERLYNLTFDQLQAIADMSEHLMQVILPKGSPIQIKRHKWENKLCYPNDFKTEIDGKPYLIQLRMSLDEVKFTYDELENLYLEGRATMPVEKLQSRQIVFNGIRYFYQCDSQLGLDGKVVGWGLTKIEPEDLSQNSIILRPVELI